MAVVMLVLYVCIATGLLPLIVWAEAQSGTSTEVKPSFSTAIVDYQYSGFETGSGTAYIDIPGNKIALEKHTRFKGTTKDKPEISFFDGQTLYVVDLDTLLALRSKKNKTDDLLSVIFPKPLAGAKPVRTETVAGQSCEVYEGKVASICLWNGVLLLQWASNHPRGEDFNYEERAVSILTNVAIPPEKFALPPGAKVQGVDQMIDKLGKRGR